MLMVLVLVVVRVVSIEVPDWRINYEVGIHKRVFREENEIAGVKLMQLFLTPVIHYFSLENG